MSRGWHISDSQLRDVCNVRPNALGRGFALKNLLRGDSIAACFSKFPDKIRQEIEQDSARRAAAANLILEEQQAWKPSNPELPPLNFEDLVVVITRRCALLHTLYSADCPLYVDLSRILDVLETELVVEDKHRFTPKFCVHFVWQTPARRRISLRAR